MVLAISKSVGLAKKCKSGIDTDERYNKPKANPREKKVFVESTTKNVSKCISNLLPFFFFFLLIFRGLGLGLVWFGLVGLGS